MLAGMRPRSGAAARLARLSPAIGLGCFALAAFVLGRLLSETSPTDLARHLAHFPRGRVAVALLLTALDFVPLFGLDRFALQVMGRTVPVRRLFLSSVVGYAFSRAVGLAVLSGGAIRYRLLRGHGLDLIDVARLVAVAAMISWLGFLLVGGLALLWTPAASLILLHLSPALARALGVLMLAALPLFIVLSARRIHALQIGARSFHMPAPSQAIAMIFTAAFDWILAAAVPYVLLAPPGVGLAQFIAVFMVAQVAGVVSQVPGGLGVFETVVLLFLGPAYDPAAIIGALLVYRVIYYFLPLGGAAALLLGHKVRAGRRARAATRLRGSPAA
jgi:uncharacterized membrane protein YbhN (UPF0104 family)